MNAHAEVQKSLARGTKQIGAMVYWTGLRDVKVARPLWRQGLDAAGVGQALSKDPGADAVLSAATKAASRKQPRDAEKIRFELKEKGQDAVYCVMMPRVIDGRKASIEEAWIAVDAYADAGLQTPRIGTPPTVTNIDLARQAMLEETIEQYHELARYIRGEEASEALVSIMSHLRAVTLKGGMYFVHASNLDTIAKVKAFVESSTGARFAVWPVGEDAVDEARVETRDALRSKLEDVAKRVRKFTDETSVEDATPRTVATRLKLFKELDAEVDLFADVLGDAREQLLGEIAKARDSILGAYLGQADDSYVENSKYDRELANTAA